MGAYQIQGGVPLSGTVPIHGAKNSALPILAAALATGARCAIHNCPRISDVDNALAILRALGCAVSQDGHSVTVDAADAHGTEIPASLMRKMRAAVIFLGALVARFGQARLSDPGGCRLGARPIDLHLLGLRLMGADCRYEGETLLCDAPRLCPATIALPFPSVGATENLILAALACKGEVVLCNAAKEPEIGDLIGFLRACGAELSGDGTSVLRISGGKPLHGAEYSVMPDRMEAATYLAAAAATRGAVTLERVRPQDLSAVTRLFAQSGCEIAEGADRITLACERLHAPGAPIRTAPYPGFPTDAQAPVMAALATADGVSVLEETVFSDRFRHVPALCSMGAKIYAAKRCAVVEGVPRLHGARVEATDLRGGAAMVVSALCAQGQSVVSGTEHMERGYEAFVPTLRACGAKLHRTE